MHSGLRDIIGVINSERPSWTNVRYAVLLSSANELANKSAGIGHSLQQIINDTILNAK